MAIYEYLVFPDCHLPYHAKHFQLPFKVAKDLKHLKAIYSLGDLLECESVSDWPSHEFSYRVFKAELDDAKSIIINTIRKPFSRIPLHVIMGNHEDRYDRYLKKSPEMFGLTTSIQSYMESTKYNIIWHSYRARQLIRIGRSNVYGKHTPPKGGVAYAKNSALWSGVNLLVGHMHTVSHGEHKYLDGRVVTCDGLGWLGNERYKTFDYRGDTDIWAAAFAIVRYDTKSKRTYNQVIRIQNNECMYNGKLYKV